MRYYPYSEYMKKKYGEKIYKLPVSLKTTCPNRIKCYESEYACGDADEASGCTFCGEKGTGFENLSAKLSVTEQLMKNMSYIGSKYKAKRFAAYFQSYTNTFMDIDKFSSYMEEAFKIPEIVEVCISTRPDCVSDMYLEKIKFFAVKYKKAVVIELGLQSINHRTLKRINRGHSLAEFIDAANRIHALGFEICAHMIINLPWDDDSDAVEGARILSALRVEQVKLHSLYIEKGTKLSLQYEKGEFSLISAEEYALRVVKFLENLSPNICIQRLVSRAPEEDTVFCNWSMSWWKIRDMIEDILEKNDTYQGKKADYLNRDYYFYK